MERVVEWAKAIAVGLLAYFAIAALLGVVLGSVEAYVLVLLAFGLVVALGAGSRTD